VAAAQRCNLLQHANTKLHQKALQAFLHPDEKAMLVEVAEHSKKRVPSDASFVSCWMSLKTRGSDRLSAKFGSVVAALAGDEQLRADRHFIPRLKWAMAQGLRQKLWEDLGRVCS
jgi:hypothetical protein